MSGKKDASPSEIQEITHLASLGAFPQGAPYVPMPQQGDMSSEVPHRPQGNTSYMQAGAWPNVGSVPPHGGFQAMLQQPNYNQGHMYHMPPAASPYYPPYPNCPMNPHMEGQYHGSQGQVASRDVGGTAGSSHGTSITPAASTDKRSAEVDVTSPPRRPQGSRRKKAGQKAPLPSQGDEDDEVQEVERETQTHKIKKSNYHPAEDRLLVTSWMEISCDPMTNTGQKLDTFWQRVVNLYNTQCAPYPERTQRSLQTRYDVIKKEVAKFSSYMADVLRRNPSGMTDSDKVSVACAEFASQEKSPFQLMHCWEIMKNNPKFMDTKHGRKLRPAENMEFEEQLQGAGGQDPSGDHSGGTPTSTASKRPLGREAAKRAAKKAASNASGGSEFAASLQDLMLGRLESTEGSRKERQEAFMAWKMQAKEDEKKRADELLEIERVKINIKEREYNIKEKELALKEKHTTEELALKKKAIDAEVTKTEILASQEDERILSLDLSTMQGPLRDFYEMKQRDILARIARRRAEQGQ